MDPLPVPALAPREIHLWAVRLDPPQEHVDPLRALLSPDELKRAARFHFDVHRRRYIVRRGVLRRLLAGYSGLSPARLGFDYGDRDKPSLAGEMAKSSSERLEFNLTDSEDLALYAFAQGAEIGVDVEIIRPMPDALSISESFFSNREREALRCVDDECVAEAFFNCWTRKEAYLKAIGTGLAEPLASFSVTLLPGEDAHFLHFDKDVVEAWSLVHLRPSDDSIGALALRHQGFTVRDCGWVDV